MFKFATWVSWVGKKGQKRMKYPQEFCEKWIVKLFRLLRALSTPSTVLEPHFGTCSELVGIESSIGLPCCRWVCRSWCSYLQRLVLSLPWPFQATWNESDIKLFQRTSRKKWKVPLLIPEMDGTDKKLTSESLPSLPILSYLRALPSWENTAGVTGHAGFTDPHWSNWSHRSHWLSHWSHWWSSHVFSIQQFSGGAPDVQHGPLGVVQALVEKVWTSIRRRWWRPCEQLKSKI